MYIYIYIYVIYIYIYTNPGYAFFGSWDISSYFWGCKPLAMPGARTSGLSLGNLRSKWAFSRKPWS